MPPGCLEMSSFVLLLLSWLSASLLVQSNEVEGPWVETFEVMNQNKSFQLKVLLWGIWLQQTNKIVSRPMPLSH